MDRLTTGLDSLDAVLHGGLPRGALLLLLGSPGSGKTTLALQTLFANGAEAAPALYFSTLAEPIEKVISYQQGFDFFRQDRLGSAIRFLSLASSLQNRNLVATLTEVVRPIQEHHPSLIVIDSFKAIADVALDPLALRGFLNELSIQASALGTTILLVGEYLLEESYTRPEFAIADGVLGLALVWEGARASRVLRVHKLRGSAYEEGEHVFTITPQGLQVYPCLQQPADRPDPSRQLIRDATGSSTLDSLLDGGFLQGGSVLVSGGPGSGKTTLGLQFAHAGLQRGERVLFISAHETPEQLVRGAPGLSADLTGPFHSGQLTVMYRPPGTESHCLRLETLAQGLAQAKRIVVDDIGALRQTAFPYARQGDCVPCLARLFQAQGITSLFTLSVEDPLQAWQPTTIGLAALMDTILLLRSSGSDPLSRTMVVLKARRVSLSHAVLTYEVTPFGLNVTGPVEPEPPRRRRGWWIFGS